MPVELSVAATLRAIMPDLPIPDVITRRPCGGAGGKQGQRLLDRGLHRGVETMRKLLERLGFDADKRG